MSEKKQSNHSALSTKMGDIYHYYIAIDVLLDVDNWNKCLIEKHGDIVLLNKDNKQVLNMEVKHHHGTNELLIHQEEFQKKLFNWYEDRSY